MTALVATSFWQTGLGGAASHILPAIGIVIVIGAILWSLGDVLRGKAGHAALRIVGAAIVAAIISSPSAIGGLVSSGKTVVHDTSNSAGQLAHTTAPAPSTANGAAAPASSPSTTAPQG